MRCIAFVYGNPLRILPGRFAHFLYGSKGLHNLHLCCKPSSASTNASWLPTLQRKGFVSTFRRDIAAKRHWSVSAINKVNGSSSGLQGWPDAVARMAKTLGGLALAVTLLIAALPYFLSTSLGTRLGTSMASRFLPGIVNVQQAELGWNKKVKLTDVSLKSPENLGAETLAKAASISSSARLWDIVRGLPYDVFIDRAWVDYTLSASGQIKWKQLLDYNNGKTAKPNHLAEARGQADLIKEAEEIDFTAEGRLLTASFYAGGLVKIPKEVKEVIGHDLHLAAIVGESNLRDSADELGIDISWIPETASKQLSAPPQSVSAKDANSSSTKAARAEPTMVSLRSEHMDIQAKGWRQSNGDLVLVEPAGAVLDFTPALAEYGLGRLSPLLSGVLAVEGGKVAIRVTPENYLIPSDSYHVRVEPLRVAINRQDLLAKAIEFMRLKEGREIAQTAMLQGATSAIHVDIDDDDVVSRRVDLLVSASSNGKGLHLCTWGSIKPTSNDLDISLGIPASALALIGLKGVPESDMLVIPVSGKTSSLRVNWSEAYKRLASVAAKQPGNPNSMRGKLLHGVIQALDARANAPGLSSDWEIPDPVEPLPWKGDRQRYGGTVEVDSSTVKMPDKQNFQGRETP